MPEDSAKDQIARVLNEVARIYEEVGICAVDIKVQTDDGVWLAFSVLSPENRERQMKKVLEGLPKEKLFNA